MSYGFKGKYRCPTCVSQGKRGENLSAFLPGVPLKSGLPDIDMKPPYWIYCLTCYADNKPGIRFERGLVMEVTPLGDVIELPADGVWKPSKV